jgi:hypothetical protein
MRMTSSTDVNNGIEPRQHFDGWRSPGCLRTRQNTRAGHSGSAAGTLLLAKSRELVRRAFKGTREDTASRSPRPLTPRSDRPRAGPERACCGRTAKAAPSAFASTRESRARLLRAIRQTTGPSSRRLWLRAELFGARKAPRAKTPAKSRKMRTKFATQRPPLSPAKACKTA